MKMYWLEFFISAVVIIFSGIRLTTYADKLSDRLQLGKIWIGIILLGLVTSLPEAVTSLVAVISLRADDLAIGNLLGSNNFNPMFIVVMDMLYRKGSITNAIHPNKSHNVSALFAVFLTCLVIIEIFLSTKFPVPHIGPLSMGTLLIAVFYIAGMRLLASLGMDQAGAHGHRPLKTDTSLTGIWFNVLVCSLFVIGGAVWLANSADIIAEQTGLGRTFVGSIFLAFVTSLPELVVTLSALKLGSLDLAIGNIFGSNMTNIFILFVCGLFHLGGPLLGVISKTHIATAVLSILLTFIALTGIHIKNKKTVLGLGWDSFAMVCLFIIGTGFLYKLR